MQGCFAQDASRIPVVNEAGYTSIAPTPGRIAMVSTDGLSFRQPFFSCLLPHRFHVLTKNRTGNYLPAAFSGVSGKYGQYGQGAQTGSSTCPFTVAITVQTGIAIQRHFDSLAPFDLSRGIISRIASV